MLYSAVNRFRAARGRILRAKIDALVRHLDREIEVLDVGGHPDYWGNVGLDGIARITLLNIDPGELVPDSDAGGTVFARRLGDARDLEAHEDGSVDLVHSNSVIEHVGGWDDMARMAGELMRVGRAGWVQTPAVSFPIEPHFRTLAMHWFGRSFQARMMGLSFDRRHRNTDLAERRRRVERINLLGRREVETLFPGHGIHVERVIIAKSYTVHWMPEGARR